MEKELKVGDRVLVHSNTFRKITRIVRETKTQWIVEDGWRFNKQTLAMIGGGSYNIPRIEYLSNKDYKFEIIMNRIKKTRKKLLDLVDVKLDEFVKNITQIKDTVQELDELIIESRRISAD